MKFLLFYFFSLCVLDDIDFTWFTQLFRDQLKKKTLYIKVGKRFKTISEE